MNPQIMDTIIKINSQSAGRDRLIRCLQYGSMVLGHLLERNKADKDVLSKLKNIQYNCGTGRMLLRLGRCLDTFYGTLSTIHLPDVVLRLTLTMSRINQSLYLLMDHILWAGRVGLGNIDKDKWSKRSAKFWFFSIVLNLLRDLYEIMHVARVEISQHSKRQRWASLTGSNSQYNCNYEDDSNNKIPNQVISCMKEHPDVVIDTIKNGCDIWIPMNTLGYVKLSPGVIGFLGVLSSVVGLMSLTNPIMKLTPI